MKNSLAQNLIADNRKARFNYHLEQFLEAGIALEGWEVKSLRAGHAQISESYVVMKGGEAMLINAHITPLTTISTHIKATPDRTRKLLLHASELNKLIGAVQRQGYTIVPVNLHWNHGKVKVEIALAKGKKQHDKREAIKKRELSKQIRERR